MKKRIRMNRILLFLVVLFLGVARSSVDAQAQTVYTKTTQVTAFLTSVLSDVGNTEAKFTTNFAMSRGQLTDILSEASIANNRLMMITQAVYSYAEDPKTKEYTYNMQLSPAYFRDVTVMNSEKQAYAKALRALKKRDYKTEFYSENNMYYDTFLKVLEQHPEYNYNVVIWKASNDTCGYRLNDGVSAAQVKTMMTKANKRAIEVVDEIITDDMTVTQKYRAIHDYIVGICKYDMELYESGSEDWDLSYTAYGCLFKKKAVCQGYAAAFNLLCAKAELCSISVSGTAKGGSHAWNYVRIGSKYRYIDATWDDPVSRSGKESLIHTYFMLTADELAKDHSWVRTKFAVKYVKYSKYAF